eukprot:scaffold289850_cov35-Tisochrysis_lutea.AAC.1
MCPRCSIFAHPVSADLETALHRAHIFPFVTHECSLVTPGVMLVSSAVARCKADEMARPRTFRIREPSRLSLLRQSKEQVRR